jgi:4'-phosphopantetheinyl transferase
MPLIVNEPVSRSARLGVWRIEEPAGWFLQQLELSPGETEFLRSVRNEGRKKQWLSTRTIVARLLNRSYSGLVYDECGKPRLGDGRRHISITHSGDYSAVIISDRYRVGIDIERARDRIERVADRFLSEEELRMIGSEKRLQKLCVCWGAKESIYKLNGTPTNFIRDMVILPFDYLCKGNAFFTATGMEKGDVRFYRVYYREIGDYILTYILKGRKGSSSRKGSIGKPVHEGRH